jgi:hypothetical protein
MKGLNKNAKDHFGVVLSEPFINICYFYLYAVYLLDRNLGLLLCRSLKFSWALTLYVVWHLILIFFGDNWLFIKLDYFGKLEFLTKDHPFTQWHHLNVLNYLIECLSCISMSQAAKVLISGFQKLIFLHRFIKSQLIFSRFLHIS